MMKKAPLGPIVTALGINAVIWGCIFFFGCTVAPKEIRQRQASFTSTGQDSGILTESGDHEGFPVNQDWIIGYDALLKTYGKTLLPIRKAGDRDGITKEGDHWRVSDAVMERFLVLNQRRVDNQGP